MPEKSRPLISIIIPMYNAAGKIEVALDSIYNQQLSSNIFEVICVDDCSPLSSSVESVESYIERKGLTNLRIIRHTSNKRQGGARNTAVRNARGVWAVYLDQDDYFEEGALSKLVAQLETCNSLDCIIVDYAVKDTETNKIREYAYLSKLNNTEIMKGTQFLHTQNVPWTPWSAVYRIDFLKQSNIWFAEGVRFEDVDYVFSILINSALVKFIPLVLVVHTQSETQQSAVGNHRESIIDHFKINHRIKHIAETVIDSDSKTGNILLGYHWFKYEYNMRRLFWRLSYSDMQMVLKKYPPYTPVHGKRICTAWSQKYPLSLCVLCYIAGPFLKTAFWGKNRLRRVCN